MPTIYSYQKHIDASITRELLMPADPQTGQPLGTELCTIDGLTYVSIPDGISLPVDQPPEIGTPHVVTLTDALKAQIKAASPHVRLIDERVVVAIRSQYSVNDELKLLRLALSTETSTYNAYVEDCRSWGRGEKTKLGL